jgi:hypothetical protein
VKFLLSPYLYINIYYFVDSYVLYINNNSNKNYYSRKRGKEGPCGLSRKNKIWSVRFRCGQVMTVSGAILIMSGRIVQTMVRTESMTAAGGTSPRQQSLPKLLPPLKSSFKFDSRRIVKEKT